MSLGRASNDLASLKPFVATGEEHAGLAGTSATAPPTASVFTTGMREAAVAVGCSNSTSSAAVGLSIAPYVKAFATAS